MPSATYRQNDVPKCPCCGKEQDDVVEDFVVPGKFGSDSSADDECVHCYAAFTVTAESDGTFFVESAE